MEESWNWDALQAGDRVYVNREIRPYYVKCRDDRFIICTKPFNLKHTVFYFIVDMLKGIRGTDDRVFCAGYETQEQCEERLKELQIGTIGVSLRQSVPLEKCLFVRR